MNKDVSNKTVVAKDQVARILSGSKISVGLSSKKSLNKVVPLLNNGSVKDSINENSNISHVEENFSKKASKISVLELSGDVPLPEDDDADLDIDRFYQKPPEEMTKTTEQFFKDENTIEYNKVDQKMMAIKHSETMANAMLF